MAMNNSGYVSGNSIALSGGCGTAMKIPRQEVIDTEGKKPVFERGQSWKTAGAAGRHQSLKFLSSHPRGHDTRALQAWLGHKNIQHTVRYAELAPERFKNFWR